MRLASLDHENAIVRNLLLAMGDFLRFKALEM